tara:strand:+ start:2925 stop:3254 length:330 start_codon:yes stop_codon:yes gene_type:complete
MDESKLPNGSKAWSCDVKLINGSKDGENSRNSWFVDGVVIHYCPFCGKIENCIGRDCYFSTINGTHVMCWIKYLAKLENVDIDTEIQRQREITFERIQKSIETDSGNTT